MICNIEFEAFKCGSALTIYYAKGGDILVKVIVKPKKEEKVLASVKKDAKAKDIHKSIIARAEFCVDPLCGCSSSNF